MAIITNVTGRHTDSNDIFFKAQTANTEMATHLIDLLVENAPQAVEFPQKNGELDLAAILNTVANAVVTSAEATLDYDNFKTTAVKPGAELKDYVEVTCKQCALICRVSPTDDNAIQRIAKACRCDNERNYKSAQGTPAFTELDLAVVYAGVRRAYFKAYVGWDKRVRIQTVDESYALFLAEKEVSCK